jgi:hypothetical protein
LLANVVTYEIQGYDHIPVGASHPPYNSNPPTSGWHYAEWARWGVYREAIPDGHLVHNLEHGGIWISYRDTDDLNTILGLEAVIAEDPDRIIMTYRPENDSPIAVAAWGALLKLDRVGAHAIRAFIQRYRYQGPENVP